MEQIPLAYDRAKEIDAQQNTKAMVSSTDSDTDFDIVAGV